VSSPNASQPSASHDRFARNALSETGHRFARKDTIRETTRKLQRRGLRTSASELIVLLVTRGLRDIPLDQLEHEIIQMRQEQAR
jgi:hypothetical protein